MPRAVPEWIGKTDDAAIPRRVRVRVFDRFDGRCQCGCSRKIGAGESWDCDHIIALINGGEHRERNLHPLLTEHHKPKTAEDVAEKSATYKRRARHVGAKPRSSRPMPGSRASGWRKRMDGTVERR